MDNLLGYIRYVTVGAILSPVWFQWKEVISTAGEALFVGFVGGIGALLARIISNWVKRKWPKLFDSGKSTNQKREE